MPEHLQMQRILLVLVASCIQGAAWLHTSESTRHYKRPKEFRSAESDDAWSTEPSWEKTFTSWSDDADLTADSRTASNNSKLNSEQIRADATLRARDASQSVHSVDSKLGKVDSHQLVDVSASEGRPLVRVGHSERFVYVDEQACIGCTLCAGAAPATFFMEESFGRARVYQQQGDAAPVIQNAIDLCPVSCIHYVPFPKLGALEVRRRTQKINPRSRRGDMPGEAPRDDIPLWTEQLWEVDEDKVAKARANPNDPNRWDDIEKAPTVRTWEGDSAFASDKTRISDPRVLDPKAGVDDTDTLISEPPPQPPTPAQQEEPAADGGAAPAYRRRADL